MKVNRVEIITQLEEKRKAAISEHDEALVRWKANVEAKFGTLEQAFTIAVEEYKSSFYTLTSGSWPPLNDDPRVLSPSVERNRLYHGIIVHMPDVPSLRYPHVIDGISRALTMLRANDQKTVTLPGWIERFL